jgi:thiamine biosynthesis protein ThiI
VITYLVKPGELVLKGSNQPFFQRALLWNLAALLRGTEARIERSTGRTFVHCREEQAAGVEDALDHLLGITGWARTSVREKTVEAVTTACVELARRLFERGARSFKVQARRTDKSFPLNSCQIAATAGAAVLNAVAGLRVDVHQPDAVITCEIRERAYIYSMGVTAFARGPGGGAGLGRRGLPVGTAGRGLLLLSGGIDSPVAGYLMARRGLRLEALYFHAWPYTSDEARRKVVRLAEIVGRYAMGIRLHVVGFTVVQKRIKERAPEAWATVLLRMAMMDCAERIAFMRHCHCLITGESLGQVASQTIENITCVESRVTLPLLRPLIGMDKEGIIRVAQDIGTYETSILPYEDCCVLFSPKHPMLKGDVATAKRLYEGLELAPLIEDAVSAANPPGLVQ